MAQGGWLLVAVAVVLGAACATLLVPELIGGVQGTLRATRARARLTGAAPARNPRELFEAFARDRCRNGCAPLRLPARWLLKWSLARHACATAVQALATKGVPAREQALCEIALCLYLVVTVAVGVVCGQLVFGACLGIVALWLLLGRAHKVLHERDERLREQVPDALRSIGLCFSAGLSLQQALIQTGDEVADPLGSELRLAGADLQAGRSVTEALQRLKQRAKAADLTFVTVALEVQHATGGSLQDILENAAQSVTASFELQRSLEVQTAQARMSAKVVSIMPVLLVAVLSLVMDGYLAAFFSSAAGVAVLLTAIAMEALGICLIRRILGIETKAG
jgi:tight adherence protein B